LTTVGYYLLKQLQIVKVHGRLNVDAATTGRR